MAVHHFLGRVALAQHFDLDMAFLGVALLTGLAKETVLSPSANQLDCIFDMAFDRLQRDDALLDDIGSEAARDLERAAGDGLDGKIGA